MDTIDVIPGPETREQGDENVDDDDKKYLVKGLQNAAANWLMAATDWREVE